METTQKKWNAFQGMTNSLSRIRITHWYVFSVILFVSCNEGKQIAPQSELQSNDIVADLPPSDDEEGTRHVSQEGPDKSRYVPISYIHNYHDGPDKSKYVPGNYKHVYTEGPDKSRYVPNNYKHNYHDGPDRSRYVPESYRHAYIDGPDKSKYVPGDYKHVFIHGPDKSRYVPKDYIHNDKGYGQGDSDYSKFVPRK